MNTTDNGEEGWADADWKVALRAMAGVQKVLNAKNLVGHEPPLRELGAVVVAALKRYDAKGVVAGCERMIEAVRGGAEQGEAEPTGATAA